MKWKGKGVDKNENGRGKRLIVINGRGKGLTVRNRRTIRERVNTIDYRTVTRRGMEGQSRKGLIRTIIEQSQEREWKGNQGRG